MSWPINRRNLLPCIVKTSQARDVQSKGCLSVGCYLTHFPWVLEYLIQSHADDALDSLDDHLKIVGESCLYVVR